MRYPLLPVELERSTLLPAVVIVAVPSLRVPAPLVQLSRTSAVSLAPKDSSSTSFRSRSLMVLDPLVITKRSEPPRPVSESPMGPACSTSALSEPPSQVAPPSQPSQVAPP